MAYTEAIVRLAKIVDLLAPIGQMTKGEPLRSDDWNALVSAVNGLAQLAIVREKGGEASQEGKFAAAEHSHIGEADKSWFDPATQALIDQQGGAPETAAELKSLGAGMAELRKIVTTLQAQVKALQLRMDAIDDGGRDRDGRLGRLELRVEATHDLRPELVRMDGRFDALGENLKKALELKNQLIDHAGVPIDLPDLAARLRGVEDLRENLMGPDGQLARYRDFDTRVGALEEKLITPETLNGVIAEQLKLGGILEDLSGGILNIVKAETTNRFDEFGGKLSGVQNELSTLTLQVGTYSGALDKLSGRVSVTETQLGRVGSIETKVADLGIRTNSVEATVQQQAGTLLSLKDLQADVVKIDTRLKLLEPFGRNIVTIEERLTVFDSKLFEVDSFDNRIKAVEDVSAQVGTTNERVATLETNLSLIKTDFSKLEASSGAFDSRLSSMEGLSLQLVSTTERVGTLETQLKLATADFGKINASVSLFETRLSSVEGLSLQLVSTTERVGTLETQLKLATTNLGTINTSVDLFETRLSSVEGLSSQLATTTEKVGTLEAQLQLATADTSKLQASVSSFGSRLLAVEGLSTQFGATNQRVGVLETQLSAASADLNKLQASVGNVSTRLKTVEGLADQVATTSSRIGTLETKVTTTVADFTRLDTRLKKIELTRPIAVPIGVPR